MRILYLSQYFPPESGATQTRAYEMARGLVRAGHKVTMLTEVPNHPQGVIWPEYRRKLWVRRELDGIDVIHLGVLTSPTKTLRSRLTFYLSFMVMATLAGLLQVRSRFDVIYCTSPPLFVGGAGVALSYLRRTPLIFEVRDLWPESAVELGELSNRYAITLSAQLARLCYRRACRIVVVTRGIRDKLYALGQPAGKIELITNGANTTLFQPQPAGGAAIRRELGLENAFVTVYAGILGIAQGLETVLDAADQLRKQPQFQFLIIGAGPREEALRHYAAALDLSNVQFVGQRPRERIPEYLSAADVAVVPLRNVPLFHGALPSKMFDAWACGCPTFISIDGEARSVLEAANAGLFIPPEDSNRLAEALASMAEKRLVLREMGERGRVYVAKHYSREAQARRLSDLLEQVIVG